MQSLNIIGMVPSEIILKIIFCCEGVFFGFSTMHWIHIKSERERIAKDLYTPKTNEWIMANVNCSKHRLNKIYIISKKLEYK